MRVIAVVNQKGGSGKTTTAVNLAAVLAARRQRTLLVDLDPQGHCAVALGIPAARIEHGVEEALLQGSGTSLLDEGLFWEPANSLVVAPCTVQLAMLEAPQGPLHDAPDRDRRLSGLLDRLASRFQWCIIDCPPHIGLLVFNALRACDEALVPVETGFLALKAAQRQVATICAAAARLERPISVRVLPTMMRRESRISQDILGAIERTFGDAMVPLAIHEHDVLREAISFGQAVTEYAPTSEARADFESLADWLQAQPIVSQREGGVPAGADGSNPDAALMARLAAPRTNTRAVEPPVVEVERPAADTRLAELAQRLKTTRAAGTP